MGRHNRGLEASEVRRLHPKLLQGRWMGQGIGILMQQSDLIELLQISGRHGVNGGGVVRLGMRCEGGGLRDGSGSAIGGGKEVVGRA